MKRTGISLVAAAVLALATFAAPASVAGNNSPCQGVFASMGSVALPAGSWDLGEHTYAVTYYWPSTAPDDPGYWTADPVTFTVSADAPLLSGPVFLRLFGLSSGPGAPAPIGDTINPAQATVFLAGNFVLPGDYDTVPEARAMFAGNTVAFAWDGMAEVPGNMTPVVNGCASFGVFVNDTLHVMGQLHRHYAG